MRPTRNVGDLVLFRSLRRDCVGTIRCILPNGEALVDDGHPTDLDHRGMGIGWRVAAWVPRRSLRWPPLHAIVA